MKLLSGTEKKGETRRPEDDEEDAKRSKNGLKLSSKNSSSMERVSQKLDVGSNASENANQSGDSIDGNHSDDAEIEVSSDQTAESHNNAPKPKLGQ